MAFSGLGSGILGDPYQITTWAQFKEIAANLSSHFKLMNDIAASGAFGVPASFFTGVLDGQNYTVSAIPSNGSANALLFGCTGATVKNIKFKSSQTYGLFGPTSNAIYTTGTTFENVQYFGSNNTSAINFCNHIDNCTFINVRLKSFGTTTLAINITNSNITDCLIQSYQEIIIGGGTNSLCNSNNFTRCKFVVVYRLKNQSTTNSGGTRSYRPKNCIYTDCLFFGAMPYYVESYSIVLSEKCTYTRVSFIASYRGAIQATENIISGINGDLIQCYFGGSMTYLSGTNSANILINSERNFSATDCHIDVELKENFSTSLVHPLVGFRGTSSVLNRIFSNCSVTGFEVANSTAFTNGTDCFINRTRINESLLSLGNYNKLTEAQTLNAANFTNFDFTNIWEISEGTRAPKLRGVIYDATPYLPEELLSSVSLSAVDLTQEKISLTSYYFAQPGTLKCYISNTLDNIESAQNLVSLDWISDLSYEKTIARGEGTYYVLLVYEIAGSRQTLSSSAYHYSIAQKSTTAINVVSPNYATLNDTNNIIGNLHGTCFFNGYIYGSSRDNASSTKSSLVKILASDYTQRTYKKVYVNKTGQSTPVQYMDQIVYCNGFLWCQAASASYNRYLIRINPSDLDYMMFALDQQGYSAPIGCDERYLYLSPKQGYYNHHKIDSSLLLGSFASYNYTGAAPVALPVGAILGTYDSTTQGNYIDHPQTNYTAYFKGEIHSILIDKDYLYLFFTYQAGVSDGYHPTYGNVCELHRVNKTTMSAAGYCMIPKSTDDAAQNATHIFAGVEFAVEGNVNALGFNSSIYAIQKSDLTVLYLSTLHKDFNTSLLRASYGVKLFENYLVAQLISSKKSVIVNISDVQNWNIDYPRGAATEVIFQVQKDGVVTTNAPNEMILDNSGILHVSTWLEPTVILKFTASLTGVSLVKTPNIQTTLITSSENGATFGGYVIEEGKSPITASGFKWGTDPNNLNNDLVADPFSYDFHEELSGLTSGVYYFKAYGTNTEGTFYGNVVMFSIEGNSYNAVSLHHNDTIALLEFVNTHFGCSIRCVQDAPGVATGTTGTVTDQDGNTYDTIVINEKRWMVQNLKTKKYRNGDAIPEVSGVTAWQELSSGGYCNVI